jgi:hypothetical protein
MFKKIALTLTFLATFAVGGLSTPDTAEAWRYRGRPYVNYYWGAPSSFYGYGYYRPYRTYYRSYYSPRVVVRPYYNAYYGPGYYYGGPIYR